MCLAIWFSLTHFIFGAAKKMLRGMLANGDVHAVVLVPHAGATDPGEAQIVATQNHSTAATRHWTNSNTARLESTASTPLERVRSQMRYHYKFPGVRRSQNLPNE
jgi:hypothetical protein